MIRIVAAFLAAVLVTYLLAAAISTQLILHEVVSLGLPVPFSVRFDTTLQDLVGMAGMYLPIVAASLFIALPVSTLALRFVPVPRTLGYVIGGAAALWVLHVVMFAVFELHALPATRTFLGMAGQALAGAFGGLVFARLSRARKTQ